MHALIQAGLPWKQKRILSKFRIGDHTLRIETGRHCRPRLPPEDRLCEQCNLNEKEDEVHLLCVCPLYSNLRSKFNLPTDTNGDVDFLICMANDNVQQLSNVALYIGEALKERTLVRLQVS